MTMKKAEVVRLCDVSARLVTLTASLTLNEADHEGKILLMGASGAALTFTLPKSTGSGARYHFCVSVVNTSNYVIAAVSGDDFDGTYHVTSDASDLVEGWVPASGISDIFTMNGTTQGGVSIGDWVEFIDILDGTWAVKGWATATGDEATPFSS